MNLEFRYGLLCGAGMSMWVLIEFALGFHTTSLEIGQYSGYFSIFIPVVVIYIALQGQQTALNVALPIKAGINTGFQIAIFSAAIFTLFMFFYNNYINPEWIDAMVGWQRKNLIMSGATDDEIGRFMDQNRRMNNTLGQGIMSFISSTGLGVFVTLVELPIIRFVSSKN